jgi:hypothetical protein
MPELISNGLPAAADQEQFALGRVLPLASRAMTLSCIEAPAVMRLSGAVIHTDAGFCAWSESADTKSKSACGDI